ncbi:transglycosylase SLT domain-containing protein [Clostridium sp. AWRP]|uniref:transglycosylase SLT domain-containing protein n=1 Tax=Clostridium sp. AWRP TaxID=2212991 RepID=UPI000FD6CD48|nr:transglycosylase SLT domain-containing protein [Clostridium sp. AWRP]AZV56801.1 hypothetical protein DMR38_09425 [Clostridium sp. AWRP]
MASRVIATILSLKDNFSKTIQGTTENTKAFQRQIQHTQNDIAKFRNNIGESFGTIKTKVAGALAGLGFAEVAKKSVEFASNLVEVQNVVDQTFGKGASQIDAWSKTALNAYGLNQLQAKQFTGYLGAMMKSSGIAGDSLTKMSEDLVGLSGDMASFDNLDPEIAFEKIRSGISGETEPLKEIGINMDVANLKAYALSQGITKSYESMSQAKQVTLRYNYLMSVTADKHGDFAKTQQTFANQMRIAKANVEQMGASIATNFLPFLNKMLLTFNNGGLKSIGTIFSGIGNTIVSIANNAKVPLQSLMNSFGNLGQASGIKNLFSGIDSKPLETLKWTINSVIYGLRDLVNFVSQHAAATKTILAGLGGALIATKFVQEGVKIQGTIKDIKKGVEGLQGLSKAGKLLSSIFSVPVNAVPFIIAITVIASIAYIVIKNWTPLKNFFTGIWSSITQGASNFSNGVKNVISDVGNTIKSIFSGIGSFFSGLWSGITNTAVSVWNGIKTTASTIWNGIKSVFSTVVTSIVTFVNTKFSSQIQAITIIFNSIRNIFSSIWNGIKTIVLGVVLVIMDIISGKFGSVRTDISKILKSLGNDIRNIGNNIRLIIITVINAIRTTAIQLFTGMVNGIKSIWNGIRNFFSSLWLNLKLGAINGWNAFRNGISGIVSGVVSWIINTWNSIINWFATLPSRLYQSGVSMFTSLKNGISNTIVNIGSWISQKFQGFVSFFTSLPSKASTWAHDMIQGFLQGINDKIDAVKKGASNIADKIRSILHFSTPDEGPLKPYAQWMPDFINGMNEGVINTTPNIVKGVTDMATNITTPINNFVALNNTLGINAIQQLSAGISSQTSNVVATAQSLASSVLQGVKDIFGIRSPSRKMFQVGIHFMQGFINSLKSSGIGDVIKKIFGDIASLANGTLGGALGNIIENFIDTGNLSGLGKMLQGIMQNGLGFLSGGGNVAEWISAAIALTGVSSDWAEPLAEIIQHESGGDPNSINLWDSNAAAGHPSKGLMQLIDENMSDYHLPGLTDIYNPIANIAAGIKLIQHDYGSVYNVPGVRALAEGRPYVGYANGTQSSKEGKAEVGEYEAEIVTGRKVVDLRGGSKVYKGSDTKKILGSRGDIKVYVIVKGNVIGNEEFMEQCGEYVGNKVLAVIDNQ